MRAFVKLEKSSFIEKEDCSLFNYDFLDDIETLLNEDNAIVILVPDHLEVTPEGDIVDLEELAELA